MHRPAPPQHPTDDLAFPPRRRTAALADGGRDSDVDRRAWWRPDDGKDRDDEGAATDTIRMKRRSRAGNAPKPTGSFDDRYQGESGSPF